MLISKQFITILFFNTISNIKNSISFQIKNFSIKFEINNFYEIENILILI